MIEVAETAPGEWSWPLISAAGRPLTSRTGYPCQDTAIDATRLYRGAFLARAEAIDWRQGRCI